MMMATAVAVAVAVTEARDGTKACLFEGNQNEEKEEENSTSSWPYSFSKRWRRLTGSLAASLAEVLEDNGVFAMRRDHWSKAFIRSV